MASNARPLIIEPPKRRSDPANGRRPTTPRVALQVQRVKTVRRHMRRSLSRLASVVTADLISVSALLLGAWSLGRVVYFPDLLAPLAATIAPVSPSAMFRFVAALALGLVVTGSYGPGDARRDPVRLIGAAALATILPLWAGFWKDGGGALLVSFAAGTLVVSAALTVGRVALVRALLELGIPRMRLVRTLFVGSRDEFLRISRAAAFSTEQGHHVVGFIASEPRLGDQSLGPVESMRRILLEETIDSVVICTKVEESDFLRIVEAAHDAGCELLSVPRDFSAVGVEPQLIWRRGQALIELTSPAAKGQEQILKRTVDVVVAGCGLIALSPLLLLVSILVKLDSPGPLFYQSPRWGRFGRRIGIWKFRTMVKDAASLLERDPELSARFASNIKLSDDPRITRIGGALRRWSIDELPQLWNVLVGDLSLVGPRPKLFGEEGRYGEAFETVLAVRPGITGLWQVSGRNATTYEERIALDVKYASHPSLSEDLRILLKTVPVVLRGTGAH